MQIAIAAVPGLADAPALGSRAIAPSGHVRGPVPPSVARTSSARVSGALAAGSGTIAHHSKPAAARRARLAKPAGAGRAPPATARARIGDSDRRVPETKIAFGRSA